MLGWRTAGGAILIASTLAIGGCGKSEAPPQADTAATPQVTPQEATPSNDAAPAGQGQPSVKAYVDEFGQLREPTAEELAEAAKKGAAPAGQTKPPVARKEIRLPDGTGGVILDESTHESLQGCAQPDGSVVMKHTCEDAKSKAGKQ